MPSITRKELKEIMQQQVGVVQRALKLEEDRLVARNQTEDRVLQMNEEVIQTNNGIIQTNKSIIQTNNGIIAAGKAYDKSAAADIGKMVDVMKGMNGYASQLLQQVEEQSEEEIEEEEEEERSPEEESDDDDDDVDEEKALSLPR